MKGGGSMNRELYKSAEMKLEREISEIVAKPGFSTQDLDIMYKVLDNIKDITIIWAMKEESEKNYSEKKVMYDDDSAYVRKRYSDSPYYERDYDRMAER